MEILKEGKIDNRWVGRCRECGSIIMADVREIPTPTKPNRDNNNDDYSNGDCPYCNGISTICFMRIKCRKSMELLSTIDIKYK